MKIRRISTGVGEIEREGGMKVPARFYLPTADMRELAEEQALKQLVGVAHLPGIVKYALAMPDIHWGYGFPIGGVAAVDDEQGAVSPGGVGYDINCGVRLVRTDLVASETQPHLEAIVREIFKSVPAGVGSSHAIGKLDDRELGKVLAQGAEWAQAHGFFAASDDLERCEEGGRLRQADPDEVSATARARGRDQVGTLGSGNHFFEVDVIEEVYEPQVAELFGLTEGNVTLMVHSGSRGLGYQVCDDALSVLTRTMRSYGPDYAAIPDPQLACAPITSDAGQRYLGAMQAAANFAWANRQVMASLAVDAVCRALGISREQLRPRLVYDVCHNVAKFEEHVIDGKARRLLVHRKGATRAFGPGDARLPVVYRPSGQPVIVPGDMGRASYVLVGTEKAMQDTFGSACHGAGRVMSRHQAMRQARGRSIDTELRERGIAIMCHARRTLAEEMSEAYKDVTGVVDVLELEGIVRKVARLRPLGVVKG
jgi:tRNA-splicing ligase RtcB (3'-phosphate/5'-hydroxy nucleic acid ligase)